MSNEQGLVERLRAQSNEMCDAWPELSEANDQAADALASQSAQIAELQAEVERTNLSWEQTSVRLGAALREIADLKRALDTAREALEPFATYMQGGLDLDNNGNPMPDDLQVGWIYLSHGDFRRASAAFIAIKTKEPGHE